MAQIVEGQRYQIDGAIYVGRNGRLELEGSQTPTMQTRPADPRLPAQTQQAQNQAAASAYDPARASVDLERARADATRAQIELERMRQNPAGLTDEQRGTLTNRLGALDGFESALTDLERVYQETYQNGGSILGMGEAGNPAARIPNVLNMNPSPSRFEAASNRLLGYIAQSMGFRAQEGNTPLELQLRYGPYLPTSADSDQVIEEKMSALRGLLDNQRLSTARQLGVSLDAPPQAVQPPGTPPSVMDRTTPTVTAAGPGGRTELSRGDLQVDPAQRVISREIGSRLSNMMKSGAPDADIRVYAIEQGVPRESIDEALQFRRSPQWQEWRRQRPNEAYPFRDETFNVPMSGVSSVVAGAAASPVGTGVIHSGNAMTAGTMPIWGQAFGGDAEQIRMGLDATREANPVSAFAGDMVGAASIYGAGGRAAARLGGAAATNFPRLSQFLQSPGQFSALTPRAAAGDVAYGALQGAGENADPLSGIAENVAGGMFGRQAPRALASTISPTGGRMAPFYAEGGRPTLGQRFRGAGWLGDTVNFVEEAAQSVPLGGRMIRNARQGARDQWQRGRWDEALGDLDPVRALPGAQNIGTRLPKDVSAGTRAHQYSQQQFNDAYDAVRSRLTFREDSDWNADLGKLALSTRMLSSDDLRRWNNVFSESVQRRIANGRGALAGDDFKMAASEINAALQQARNNPNSSELIGALGALDDALHQGARRHSPPEVVTALDAVDRGYSKQVTLENAARRRLGPADTDPGEFSGSDILQLGRNEGVRGRRFLRGETPFYDQATLGRNLEDVMPSSGTAERTATMGMLDRLSPYAGPAAGLGAAGGAMMMGADPMMIGGAASIPIALNAPGVKQTIDAMLSPRGGMPEEVSKRLREELMRGLSFPRLGGMFGAPAASYGSERQY